MTNAADLPKPSTGVRGIRGRLMRGSSVYLLSSSLLRLLGFAVLTIYARFLTPRDFGIVSIAESASLAIGVVAGLGLESGCRRLYFHYVKDPNALRGYLGTVTSLAAAAGAVCLALAYLVGPWLTPRFLPNSPFPFFPYFALPIFTAIASQVLSCGLVVFQCQERHFAYSGFVALQSLSTTVLTLVLVVWTHHGAAGLLLARALGTALTLLAAARVFPIFRARIHWAYVNETLSISIPLAFHSLMAAGLIVIDRFILQHYRPLSEVGLYSLAYSFGMTLMTLFSASVYRGWAPLFYSLLQKGGESRRTAGKVSGDLLLLMSVLACIGCLLAPYCVHWLFDRRYWPAADIAGVLICAYLFHSAFALFQLPLIQARRSMLVPLVSSVALATNIVLNLAWIPQFGIAGAAYATLAAYAVEAGLAAVVAQRVNRLPFGALRMCLALAVGVIGLAGSRLDLSAMAISVTLGFLLVASAALSYRAYRERRLAGGPTTETRPESRVV